MKIKNTPPNWNNSEEIKIDPNKILLSTSKVDSIGEKSVITYCNEYLCEVSGYKEWELVGTSHNVFRHADMPEIIFKLIKSRLVNKDPITAIVKNSTKSGKYYWVQLQFEILEDNKGNITGYKSFRKHVPSSAVEIISKIYKRLVSIEKHQGIGASEGYLIGYLDGLNTMYDTFIEELLEGKNAVSMSKIESSEKNKLNSEKNKLKLVSGFLSIF